jgi:anthranilate/para-aminobenzoate synthase component II
MRQVLVIDNQTVHLEALRSLILSKIPAAKIVVEATREVLPEHIAGADLVILSGGTGRSIERNPRTFGRIIELISEYKKPCIGICLGAEAIAVAYGASLVEMPVRRVGNIAIYLNANGEADLGMNSRVIVYEFHKWMVVPSEVTDLEILADSKDGIEIFRHKELPLFGLQFHPEVLRKGNAGHIIFEQLLAKL